MELLSAPIIALCCSLGQKTIHFMEVKYVHNLIKDVINDKTHVIYTGMSLMSLLYFIETLYQNICVNTLSPFISVEF